jgi:GNAT superfamily N-acetyltransferase
MTSVTAIVRLADIADAPALASLSTQLGYAVNGETIKQRLIGLQKDPAHTVFAAEADGAVIGWLHVFLHQLLESELMAEVGGLVVDQKARGTGVGRLLMDRAEQWARDHGCAAVTLRTNIVRKDAHAFYEKLGYANVKTQHTYRKRL